MQCIECFAKLFIILEINRAEGSIEQRAKYPLFTAQAPCNRIDLIRLIDHHHNLVTVLFDLFQDGVIKVGNGEGEADALFL